MATTPVVVDVHTHIYPPSYISLLSSRKTVPYIHQPEDGSDPRLIILPSDDDPNKSLSERGRPIDKTYSSWTQKISFMSLHNISASVVSLANPWLDWLEADVAAKVAAGINNDLDEACQSQNATGSKEKLYAFACLPLSAPTEEIIKEIDRLHSLPSMKGIVLGTTGLGAGLDDPNMEPIWSALAKTKTMIFLHPHYGLPDEAFGGPSTIAKSGHVLPLALGFPLETTIAVTRMYLAGVFDRHQDLQMLLAHSGGTLPFLAGRIESCVEHERDFIANGGHKQGPQRSIWDVLKSNIYLDAVIYGSAGLKAAIEAGGIDRLMFGTDHPFFPPLNDKSGKWLSVVSNNRAIDATTNGDDSAARLILGGNAAKVLGLET